LTVLAAKEYLIVNINIQSILEKAKTIPTFKHQPIKIIMQKIEALLSLFLYVGLFAKTSSAKQSPELTDGMPKSQGMSPERLTKIDAMLQ
jgi:hypothetical protein